MPEIQPLQDYAQLRLLADPRRMRILRLLMAGPATLTQLAQRLQHSPAWVRHHVLVLESAGLIELAETRTTGRVTEKFYRARSGAFLLQRLILPQGKKPLVLFSGSDEPALDLIAVHLQKHMSLMSLRVGSLDGLINLRQRLCHLSGAHLLDEGGEYNTPFIRHIFPDRAVSLVTLAQRTQGWMLAAGNPKGIQGIQDVVRSDVRFVNRNPGSGTRLWIDRELHRVGLEPGQVSGYRREFSTHAGAAEQISAGRADVSLGLHSAAHALGLDFIPLFEERYDLVFPSEQEKIAASILDYIQTKEFRAALASLIGYSAAQTGQQIHV
jgi:putative molybdopterin biosynthesis protein